LKIDRENLKNEFKTRIYHWTLRLIKVMDELPRSASSQIMAAQLLRSGTSVGANYVEAQASPSRKDFANFLHHALKSANESKFWLALLRDSGKMQKENADDLLNELSQLANVLGASLLTIKGRR